MIIVGNIGLSFFILVCTYFDCRYKGIPVKWLAAGIITAGLFALFMVFQDKSLAGGIIVNLLPGAAMLLGSRLIKDKIGYADGIMVLAAGLVLLPAVFVFFLTAAFFLIFIWAVLLLVCKKGNRNTQIPFAPFLLAAQCLLWIKG